MLKERVSSMIASRQKSEIAILELEERNNLFAVELEEREAEIQQLKVCWVVSGSVLGYVL